MLKNILDVKKEKLVKNKIVNFISKSVINFTIIIKNIFNKTQIEKLMLLH